MEAWITAFQPIPPSATFRRPTWSPALDFESRYVMTSVLLQLDRLRAYQHPKLADQLSKVSEFQSLLEQLQGFDLQVSNLQTIEAELCLSTLIKPDTEPGFSELKNSIKAERVPLKDKAKGGDINAQKDSLGGTLKDNLKVDKIDTKKDTEPSIIVVLRVNDKAYWACYPGRFGLLIFPDDFEYKPWEVKNCVVGHEICYWATCTHCYALANGTSEGSPKIWS